jgi:hypothetical protein
MDTLLANSTVFRKFTCVAPKQQGETEIISGHRRRKKGRVSLLHFNAVISLHRIKEDKERKKNVID